MEDRSGFLTTLGRELSEAIEEAVPDASSQDCYDALTRYLDEDFNLNDLAGLNEEDYKSITDEFCQYFEVDEITTEQIKSGIARTVRNWS